MRVLIVASYNKGRFAPFVMEQAAALQQAGVEIYWFGVQGHGVRGYLKQLRALKQKIREMQPNLIHAHYGLCGLLANLQRKVPVVTTYHGSDINDKKTLPYSRISMLLSKWNIFVSERCVRLAGIGEGVCRACRGGGYSQIPCGVNLTELGLTSRAKARQEIGLQADKPYVLFAGAKDVKVKNYPLAEQAINILRTKPEYADTELLELRGYSREEVTLLMCAADALLLTSHTEGSPQVVKEAMVCGCPIVSVDVGDVSERVKGVEGCYVAETREPQELARLLDKALQFGGKTNGREKLINDNLTNQQVALALLEIYNTVGA